MANSLNAIKINGKWVREDGGELNDSQLDLLTILGYINRDL